MRGRQRARSQCSETYESAIRHGTRAQQKSESQKFLLAIPILSMRAWPRDKAGTDIARPPGYVHSPATLATISSKPRDPEQEGSLQERRRHAMQVREQPGPIWPKAPT